GDVLAKVSPDLAVAVSRRGTLCHFFASSRQTWPGEKCCA
ncbi:hypothetical protein A2U01_0119423, partial [Trifolium medium]|nr:hypothetical protein [Trifolium medium]